MRGKAFAVRGMDGFTNHFVQQRTMTQSEITNKFRTVRWSKGMSVNELSEKTGLHAWQIYRFESERVNTRLNTLVWLGIGLGIFSADSNAYHFGKNLKEARNQLNLSLREFEANYDLNVSYGTVGHVENGRVLPLIRTALELADALETPLEEMLLR